jgi:hypothetical protein
VGSAASEERSTAEHKSGNELNARAGDSLSALITNPTFTGLVIKKKVHWSVEWSGLK